MIINGKSKVGNAKVYATAKEMKLEQQLEKAEKVIRILMCDFADIQADDDCYTFGAIQKSCDDGLDTIENYFKEKGEL